MTQELQLLKKLYTFYNNRYSGKKSIIEERFNDSVVDLIKTGDIKKSTYYEFCVDNNIEPRTQPVAPPVTAPVQNIQRYQNYDPCGRGGASSHC